MANKTNHAGGNDQRLALALGGMHNHLKAAPNRGRVVGGDDMAQAALQTSAAMRPGLSQPRASDFLAETARIFPNVAVECHRHEAQRALYDRVVAGAAIVRRSAPSLSVYASRDAAAACGLANLFKLHWLLSGSMRFTDGGPTLEISAGEALLISMSRTYRLDMDEGYCGLTLMFDPTAHPSWPDAARRHERRVIGASGAVAAAAGAATALLAQARGDDTDWLAVRSTIDLVLASLDQGEADGTTTPPTPAQLSRAALLVARNIADPAYGPEQLARELGLSRRSLYNRFTPLGLTPAEFIRRQRLKGVRAAILSDPAGELSLGMIALRNGFPDASSLSHAFKSAYGVSPSRLRAVRGAF
jgi:AraC-like DNA-binding protein